MDTGTCQSVFPVRTWPKLYYNDNSNYVLPCLHDCHHIHTKIYQLLRWLVLLLCLGVVDCGPPNNTTNGAVNYTTTTANSTAIYTCNPGFIMMGGRRIIRCLDNGHWCCPQPACFPGTHMTQVVFAPHDNNNYVLSCLHNNVITYIPRFISYSDD